MIGFALGTSRRQFSLADDSHPRAVRRVCVGTLGRILVLDGDLVGEKNKKNDQERGLSENFNSVSILVFGFETAHSMLLPGLLPIRFARRSIAGAHYRERGGKEVHRRNNANKPITSILRNRRESGRTARWGNGGREGFLRSFEGSEKTGGEEKEKEGRE